MKVPAVTDIFFASSEEATTDLTHVVLCSLDVGRRAVVTATGFQAKRISRRKVGFLHMHSISMVGPMGNAFSFAELLLC